MMRGIYKLWCGILLFACTTDPDAKPLGQDVMLRMATTGEGAFEENIHSLAVYAFRESANGEYFYYRTLARLGESEIKALESTSGGKKTISTRLMIGSYEIYFMANGLGNYTGIPRERMTKPSDIVLTLPEHGVDSIYFLGSSKLNVGAGIVQPLSVTLSRAVSRLDMTINGVPESIDSISVTLGNITTRIAIDGSLSPKMTSLTSGIAVNNDDVYKKDTVRVSFLTFPTAMGVSDLHTTFRAKSGEYKGEKIGSAVLKPDHYVILTGNINDAPGAFLSFDITYHLFILDDWKNFYLPEFTVKPY